MITTWSFEFDFKSKLLSPSRGQIYLFKLNFILQALVRMDRHIPYEKRMARVEEVIQEVSRTM